MRDDVDAIIDQWRVVRPELDHSPIGVIGRISRIQTEPTGHCIITVEPTTDLQRLSEVVLRISPPEIDDHTPQPPTSTDGKGRT